MFQENVQNPTVLLKFPNMKIFRNKEVITEGAPWMRRFPTCLASRFARSNSLPPVNRHVPA
jgi:hypothetical protein